MEKVYALHRAGRRRNGKSVGLRRELGAADPRVRRAAAPAGRVML